MLAEYDRSLHSVITCAQKCSMQGHEIFIIKFPHSSLCSFNTVYDECGPNIILTLYTIEISTLLKCF